MKLEPIFNPHARIGQIAKKTKAEEKDELISKTKTTVLEKYAQKKAANKKAGTTANMSGSGAAFKESSNYQLEEKITAESLGIRLLTQGYMQAYIDFFYLTNDTTPSKIEPSQHYSDPKQKQAKQKFGQSENELLKLKD